MNEFMTFFMVAVLIERLTEYIKKLFGESIPTKIGTVDTFMLISLVIGILVSLGLGVDLLKQLGFDFQRPIVGEVLTGLIASGGSNYLFDIVRQFRNPIPEQPKTQTEEAANLEIQR